MYKNKKIDSKKFIAIFNTISYEVNATIGATFTDLPDKSINNIFEIARTAKADSSPVVRSAVGEFVIRQSFGEYLPDDLLACANNDLVDDQEAQKQIKKMYDGFGEQGKKSLSDKFPNLFKATGGFSLKKIINKCLGRQL